MSDGPVIGGGNSYSKLTFSGCKTSDTSTLFLLNLNEITSDGKLIASNKKINQCNRDYKISNIKDIKFPIM